MAEAEPLGPARVNPGGASRPRSPGRNLPLAILTGLVLAGLLLVTLVLAPAGFVLLLTGLVLLAERELLAGLGSRARPAAPVVFGATVLLVLGAYFRGVPALAFGMLVGLLAAFGWFLVDRSRADVTRRVAVTMLPIGYIGLCAAYVALVLAQADHYVGAIFGYAVVTVGYDVVAYAVGASVGRHPLAPSISPNKSWEGAIGATIAVGLLGGLLLPRWPPWTVPSGLTLAAAACVVAPAGDLIESMLKRDLQIKDMGALLPGHGGILDRFDALLLMAPVLWYLLVGFGQVHR